MVQTDAQKKPRKSHEGNVRSYLNIFNAATLFDIDTEYGLWNCDVNDFLDLLPKTPLIDLAVTSPPYNLGKEYEEKLDLDSYIDQQRNIINKISKNIKETGSICWQVGNYVEKNKGSITPLDILLHPIFIDLGFILRNRIIWRYGHGLHSKLRFSGRYETVLWYTKGDSYKFNLDAVRIPAKYPGKRHYKGPNKGNYSGHPDGKNPEDVWDIPNVKSNHVEKTNHPCQFPVGLIERLILALTDVGDLVFDPFTGVGSSGVAAAIHKRRFWGTELVPTYVETGAQRIRDALLGKARYRPHDEPIYDYKKSSLSRRSD
ncbi:MAG: site-specific DNA-methyltransferase [Deltaproteobacteria bacterium]|nr:site-specific DNA-methyltransferase [Deltaproteobacteria bacterium]